MAPQFHPSTFLHRHLIGLIAVGLCAAVAAVVCAQDPADPTTDTFVELPLFEQEPYDRITLNGAGDNEVLRVKPLDLPDRKLPTNPRPNDKLTVRLVDDPTTQYDVQWRSIEKVELFEQLVLAKANELAQTFQFEEAYDYFDFLQKHHPKLPGVAQGMEEFLWKEAGASHRDGQYDLALAMLREVYRRNPKRPNLDKALGMATDELIRRYEAEENYSAIRQLLGRLAAWFPDQSVVATRSSEFGQEAAGLLDAARSAMQKGDLREAARLARRQQHIWPDVSGARELAEAIHQRHPRVVVGVCMPGADATPGHLSDFGSRRSGRLLFRTLTEFAGPSTNGGRYDCPLGTLKIEALESRMSVDLRSGIGWSSGESRLTAYDAARRLLAMADPVDPAYRVDWAELLGTLTVRQVYGLDIQLHRAHVRPDALLQTVVLPYTTPGALSGTASGAFPSNGPYVVASRDQDETVYLANPQYFAAQPGQPMEIVERHFREGAQAIRALKQGQIHVLDRVSPWGLSVVREDEDLVVARYGVPLVHCLVPNMRRPLTSRRTFRRALVYGIHREAIRSQLIGGAPLSGHELLSGPFPRGMDRDDPIGYAYDETIHLRGYDPRLAIALARLSLQELATSLREQGQELTEIPLLVLAHPANEIARSVCGSIRKQLEVIGVRIALKEFVGGTPAQIPDDVDLMYAELALWEPVVDARRVLGETGISGGCSSYMSLALRQLDRTANWQETHKRLRRIHRIAHDDVAVVPLWQLTDYFAYHKSIGGIGAQPITLYQNVEQWRPALRYPAGRDQIGER